MSEAGWAKLWSRTKVEGTCYRWTGSCNRGGYGQIWFEGGVRRTHHLSYALSNNLTLNELAAIVAGRPRFSIDHSVELGCAFRDCWNPAHLELVSHRVNTLRGNTLPARQIQRTRCPRGHALHGENLVPAQLRKGSRTCLLCARANARAKYHQAKGDRVSLEDLLPAVMAKYPTVTRDANS